MTFPRRAGFSFGVSCAVAAVFGVVLQGVGMVDAARPESRGNTISKKKDDGPPEEFKPQERFQAVSDKANEITGKVKEMESSAKNAQSSAKNVKVQFNAYSNQIQELHKKLNELDVKRLEYAKELFVHFRDAEHQRLGPMFDGYKPLRQDKYSLHNDEEDKKFADAVNSSNPDAKKSVDELEGGGGGEAAKE